jgi:hypothetical protein
MGYEEEIEKYRNTEMMIPSWEGFGVGLKTTSNK